jgi:hypothetical protein
MRDGSVIVPQRPSAYLANEPAQLYRLVTQTGRAIEATANHPFLTREGWRPLSELGPSDRVAVVAEYPPDLAAAAPGGITFDHIASVDPTKVAPVYDLTVEGSHNFIAGDFVVHNSTLCSQAPDALFLATEAGLNALEVYQIAIKNWEEFLAACHEVEGKKHGFRTIIVDTLDNAFRMCSEFVCRKHKIEHESDLGYGKGFALVNTEFYRVLNKLSLLPYGLFLVAHSQEKEVDTRAGKRTRIVPTLPDKARRLVLGMVDVILYCDVDTVMDASGKTTAERRVMRTKPTETYEAGDRTGRLPDVIPLDYAAFAEAFERAAPGARARPPAAEQSAPETPEAQKPDKRQYATDAQVKEFEALVAELGIKPDVVRERLAPFGSVEAHGITRADMESILGKLRAAKAQKEGAGQA